MSASPSRSGSPRTPNEGTRSPFGRPPPPTRSATAPVNANLPSPEPRSSNLDCAFPPFPIAKPAKKALGKPQDGYLGGKIAEGDPKYAPISPRTASSGGLLQRMNTIAPGPFDVKHRRKPGSSDAGQGPRRKNSDKDTGLSMSPTEAGESIVRPATANPGHSRTSTNSSKGSKSGIVVPKQPRKNGYGGFGAPGTDDFAERELLNSAQRSKTFPIRSTSEDPSLRRPSAPNDAHERKPSNVGLRPNGSPPRRPHPSMSGPDLTRPLPPRGASLIKPRMNSKSGDAPPVPTNLNLAAEFGIGNPYHTQTDSQSSDASGYSEQSKASSRSSPPGSEGPSPALSRRPSENNKMEGLMADLETSLSELEPRNTSPNLSNKSSPRAQNQYPRPLQPPQTLNPSFLSPESPMDPAIQDGRFSSSPKEINRSPSPSRMTPENRSLSPSPSVPPQETPRPLSPAKRTPPTDKPRRPATAKGNCKGCGEAIKGKSISSADGRLTGRYHKDCFVCKTCQEPFQTATFYVLKDAPYCERHYHKLNGSVCKTCDKGIEGQYLESESKQKFHPNCLACADCRRNLRNDYFEMNGRVYCERDAFRRTQQTRFLGPAAGSNRMERRTTRLMMM